MFRALLGLPATVWLLGLISLVNDSASELLYPLVPLYLASVLMAGPRALGIIEGIAEATSSLLKLFSGVLADRTASTRRWVVGGYSLAALARPLLDFAASWPVHVTSRQRRNGGFTPSSDSLGNLNTHYKALRLIQHLAGQKLFG